MLELINVGQRYGRRTVLEGISHSFAPGVTVITGPSGAGKTTLLRLCASAERPKSGTLNWNGKPLGRSPRAFRANLGYAPQRIDFPEDISGLDFMLHMAALKMVRTAAARLQATVLLDRLGLGRDASGLIRTYSGGMRRRLGLAQAFLGDPHILVLDEPTAELDPVTAEHMHDLIFEQTAVVLMTTHLAESLANRKYQTLKISMLDSVK